MIIEVSEKPVNRGWAVQLDALEVNFNSLEEAQAFVAQLKARIDAPHVWPSTTGHKTFTVSTQGSRAVCAVE
jgi:hypothetical protein